MNLSPKQVLTQLAAIPIFQGLNPQTLQSIIDHSQTRRAEKDGFYFFQGDPARHLYVLVEGRVKLIQSSADGQQTILQVIIPWQMFGGLSMLEDAIYPISAQVVEDSQVLSWSHDALLELAQSCPQIALNNMRHMAEHVQEMQSRFMELATERVERRLARTLVRLARQVGKKVEGGVLIDLPITRQDLAEMCGTTVYTASRTLSEWERQGLVEAGRERVLIRFPHGLVRIAEDLPLPGSPDDLKKDIFPDE